MANEKISIEKNLPIPKRPRPDAALAALKALGRANKYPFEKLSIGDSFHTNSSHLAVYQAAKRYAKLNPGFKFTIRTEKNVVGCRLWRTA